MCVCVCAYVWVCVFVPGPTLVSHSSAERDAGLLQHQAMTVSYCVQA